MCDIPNVAKNLNINNSLVIRKAEELLRTFQIKASVSLKSLNDVAKTVLCLDISSTYYNTAFNKETALKLSGLKKSAYQTNLHTVEKILGLDKIVTVSDLCVQFNCTVVRDLAEEIVHKYTSNGKFTDSAHPQYVAAAVYIACKLKQIRIDKTQLIQIGRLKHAQWKKLTTELQKFATTFGIGSPKKFLTIDLKKCNEPAIEHHVPEKNETKKEEIEEYEVWKKRILDEAYAALKKINV